MLVKLAKRLEGEIKGEIKEQRDIFICLANKK